MEQKKGKRRRNKLYDGIFSRRRIHGILLFLILGSIIFAGCTKKDGKTELLIGAAASLEPAMKEVQQLYGKVHPEISLSFTFAASGTIEQQIREGAPIDLFLSAAEKQMDALEQDSLVLPDSRVDLFRNEVVLIVSKDSDLDISDFKDITKADVIALGDPESVPIGQYAERIFERLGIWDTVYAKATLGKTVTEVSTWVSSGDAGAGVVYKTDAMLDPKLKIAAVAPDGEDSIAVYPGAVVKYTKEERKSEEFLHYLKTKETEEIFVRYGFEMLD